MVEVFILMKHKLIATGILAGAILSYSSNVLADTHKFLTFLHGLISPLTI